MNNEEIRNILELYQRNELDPQRKTEVKTLLESDPAWQVIYKQLSTESQGIRFSKLQDLQGILKVLENAQKQVENNESTVGDLLANQTSTRETNETKELGNIENRPVTNLESPPDLRIIQGIRYTTLEDELKKLKGEEKKIGDVENKKDGIKKSDGRVIGIRKYWWAVAAGILVIVIGGYYLNENKKPKYVNQYLLDHFDEYVLHDKVRGPSTDSVLDRNKEIGYDLYVLKEFEEAIPYLERRWEKKRDTLALFYLEVCYAGIFPFNTNNKIDINNIYLNIKYLNLLEKLKKQ